MSIYVIEIFHNLFSRATKSDLKLLWESYHKEKYCVAAIIEPEQYRKIRERWEKYPVFCVPCMWLLLLIRSLSENKKN